jgi:hypothetical protein
MEEEFYMDDYIEGKYVTHFWYDPPLGEILLLGEVPKSIGCHIKVGEAQVCLRIFQPEMESIIEWLDEEGESDHIGPINARWDHDEDVGEPPLSLFCFRQEIFSINLPHAVGVEFLAVLKERLKEV